jgi:hypothetical protein
MQPRDLDDGEFEVGPDRRKVDTLGIVTRCAEAVIIVWQSVVALWLSREFDPLAVNG